MTPSYLIRQVNTALWRRVKSRAALEGLPLKEVILRLLTAYVDSAPRRTATTDVGRNSAQTQRRDP